MRLAASAGSSDVHGLSPADARGSGSAAVRGSRKRDAPSSNSGEAESEIVARGAGRKKGRIGIAPEVTASVTAHTSNAELQAITDPLLRASGARGPSLVEIKEMNFYDALNVQPGATNAEIRRVFKAVALKYHPDKGGDPAIFRYLCTVRDILLNKAKREQYDFYGRDSWMHSRNSPLVALATSMPMLCQVRGSCSHLSVTCLRRWLLTRPGRHSGGVKTMGAGIASTSWRRSS